MSRVALFFRAGAPHRLAPTSILVVQNWDSAVGRTTAHRGFENPEATRTHTPLELDQLTHAYRYCLHFYDSWEALVVDEQARVAEDPRIGTHFLDVCKRLAADKNFQPKALKQSQAATPEELETDLLAEVGADRASEQYDESEKQVVVDTALAIGATQLDLFGEEVLNEVAA